MSTVLLANPDSTGIGLSYEKWAYTPYFSKVNFTNVGFGNRITFPGATITANGDSINVDWTGVFWKNGLNAFTGYNKLGASNNVSVNFFSNNTRYGQLDSLGHWRFGQVPTTGSASSWHTFGDVGSSTAGVKINGSSNAYLLLSDNISEGSWDGGLHWDGTTLKLFTPVAAAAINTAGTDRLKFGATGRIFGGTVTDIVVPASDTISLLATNVAEIGLTNNKWHINSGFTRLYNGSSIMYQINHSTKAHAFNVADNSLSAFTVRTLFGAKPFIEVKSIDGLHQLTLGTDTLGSRLSFPGYGKGNKEASDLSKTFSGYIAGFGTDTTTVLDVKLFEQFEVDTTNITETISTFSAREITIILDGTDGNVTCVFPVASAALSGVKLEAARIDVSVNTVLLDPTGANNFYVASATQDDYTMVAGTSAVFRCVSIGGTYYWLRVAS